MKRFLSILLAITLMISAFSVLSVSAAEATPDEAVAPVAAEPDAPMIVPQVRVTTENGNGTSLQKADGYVNASISITDVDGTTLEGDVSFKVRGNSTALTSIQKKAFTFKFAKKQNVLGMGKGKKWALLANAFDPTLMRNYIAFELAREMGLDYTSEQRYVELWLDGSYRGCYSLIEPVQEGGDRVDIDIESNDGKKDFLIEREATRYESDVTYFTTDGVRFAVSEPEEPNADQLAYIKSVMDAVFSAVKSGDKDAVGEKLDVPSFVRYYILNELYKTVDFDFSSVFFYYKDGKLYAGPAWDYDLAAGNVNASYSQTAANSADPEGLFITDKHFYKYLCSYDWFNQEIRSTLREYWSYISDIYAEGGQMETVAHTYNDVFSRNFTDAGWDPGRWWVNVQRRPDKTCAANTEYLASWFKQRCEWLTAYYELFDYPYLLGDADGDGRVSILDATKIQRLLAGFVTDDDGGITLRGSVRRADEGLGIMDATAIQRYLAGFSSPDPIGDIFYKTTHKSKPTRPE